MVVSVNLAYTSPINYTFYPCSTGTDSQYQRHGISFCESASSVQNPYTRWQGGQQEVTVSILTAEGVMVAAVHKWHRQDSCMLDHLVAAVKKQVTIEDIECFLNITVDDVRVL